MADGEDRGAPSAAGEAPLPARAASGAELTGELPAFLRDAVGQPAPVLDEDDIETVEALQELGVAEDEARRAVLERRVPLVLAQQVIGEPGTYSLRDLADHSGVSVDVLRRIRSAAGLPTEALAPDDLRWAEIVGELLEVLPIEVVLRSARARGSALATIARSDLSMIRDELVLPMRQAGADDLTVSVALAELARSLEPLSRELLHADYRLHLQRQLGSELVAVAARTDAQEVELSVGFVDVVGYTALSARIDPAGLDQVLDRFEQRVIDVVAGRGDVHVVKYLGDAAMLVAPDPVTLADAMVDLTSEVEFLADAPLRGGLAHGDVLVREGDYFGPPVNLAARLTDVARPWRVLAADELSDVLGDAFDTRRILPTRIRSVGLRRPVALRGRREVVDEEE